MFAYAYTVIIDFSGCLFFYSDGIQILFVYLIQYSTILFYELGIREVHAPQLV